CAKGGSSALYWYFDLW
nr:immunoglobulin heavy chain junction region [Macaca mulatta]MOW98940.1 immunoglobulin heavy chain junction region [Macaca mulatta]MOW99425.1 immunoglobulin heavy chain junction region [Macaca mulatta]MOW99465.1 immunoglobulin heavy chain junction region [Macaca mulatta]MOW99661.1 immunoglobulin heavy chain junction region [Macaca mulatta]